MIDLSEKKRLERSDNVCRAITGSVSVENVHPLQGGFFRPKDRRGRRPGMPIEPIWVFYLKYLWETCRRVCDTPRIGYGLTCIVGASRASSGWLPTLTKRLGLGVSEEKREPVSDIDAVAVDSLKVLDPKRPIREADAAKLFDGPPENLKLSHYRSITVFAGISTGNPSVLPKVRRRCSHVSSCSGVFGMVT